MADKICPKCSENLVVKNWIKRGRQSYKCKNCKHRFQNQKRSSRWANKLWEEYSIWKQTYKQLGEKYWIAWKTIQRKFDKHIPHMELYYNEKLVPRSTNIIIDVSWFWKNLSVIMLKSVEYGKVVYATKVKSECVEEYAIAVAYIEEKWRIIRWVTTDWFKWVRQLFHYLPYQMCIFHQVAIITRYVWKYPKLEANKELRWIALKLKNSDHDEINKSLNTRYEKWKIFLSERSYSLDGKKKRFTHKKTRSAYRSLVTNLPVLFTHKNNQGLQSTTNMLDGYFRPLKAKLWVHCWLSDERKLRLLFKLLDL